VATFPEQIDLAAVPTGDMPGDRIEINAEHLTKAQQIFPSLWDALLPILDADPHRRAVVSVHGGSGVGKSEIGSLLAYGLSAHGVGAYVLSGDNYPRRIPGANDDERLRVYREAGAQALGTEVSPQVMAVLAELQDQDRDADPALIDAYPWLAAYHGAARSALDAYLGSEAEIDFAEINAILAQFHAGATTLRLKRMGRSEAELWYDDVDVSGIAVIVVEWTHGNSPYLTGVDLPILLHSTPEETLAHRRSRARDRGVDSPFTTVVLELEQAKLQAQSRRAAIIVAKSGEVIDEAQYRAQLGKARPDGGPMLNCYPDSLGESLADVADFVERPQVAGVFASAYLLPTLYHSDLDRGFSVIDYELNTDLARPEDLARLAAAGIDLKLDFVLNHASMNSPQFQDLLARGDASAYADFFIDWNAFWAGHGTMTDDGYIQPDPELIADMFFRKPGLPIVMVRLADGTERPYWNTFYQAVTEVDGQRRYSGQVDLNITSESVWEFYARTLDTVAGYGARIVRLDAFAYAPKQPGARNFLNDPGTWWLLAAIKELADARGLVLLPEIHSRYDEGIHRTLSALGYLTYDFFAPGLILDAIETADATVLKRWISELLEQGIDTVNMLGSHDGIPLLDLRGLLPEERIESLIAVVTGRGGRVKDLHGAKNVYYQVNATYFSALGARADRLLLARALQIFLPGKPQVWYLDLLAGENDLEAVARAGADGHKEINRTNLSTAQVAEALTKPVVLGQLELLRFRREFPAFGFDATCEVAETGDDQMVITWRRAGASATLNADLRAGTYAIQARTTDGDEFTLT
jgi:sucrose phosphorylase